VVETTWEGSGLGADEEAHQFCLRDML
jgi:hypothetical protein